jgi:hypothetical protein
MEKHHIAQINVGRIKGVTINDPVMKEFVDNLDKVNQLAESSKGFVWRLKDDDNNATAFNPYNDEQIIINLSIWETIEDLEQFAFKSYHVEYLRRRREWFENYGKAYAALWWVPANHFPTITEAVNKLAYLQEHGASQQVFDFKKRFPHP